ncbi:hydroxyacid dehydrogenase [Bosea sp. RAF48]|uniref:hydroxyacid dehydrogenase n=1 Tax=Bosea sp. RAF48 TaxID=3237480 RepID=UPI003F8E2DAB
MLQTPRLAFFERWTDDSAADAVFSQHPSVELERLRYDDAEELNRASLASAHGYQISSRVELREPWFADASLLARCPNLLAVSSTGAGYDVIDVEACTAAGVLVCNQTGTNARAVAEHALGLMLALSKRITAGDRLVRSRPNADRFGLLGNNLENKTVGIVGLGQIGRITASICRYGFNMQVLAYDPNLPDNEIVARGAVPASRDQIFAKSDFISVHCPRTSATLGSIGTREFEMMKPTAFFINTARGGIHREDDLARALSAGKLAGAGLDVFLDEPPPPSHPLMQFDNVIANPHIAAMTQESNWTMAHAAAQQWIDIFTGKVPPRLVNPEALPRFRDRFQRLSGGSPGDDASNDALNRPGFLG